MQQPQPMANPSYPYDNVQPGSTVASQPPQQYPPQPQGINPQYQSQYPPQYQSHPQEANSQFLPQSQGLNPPNYAQSSQPPHAYPYQPNNQFQPYQPIQPIQPGQAIMFGQPQVVTWTNRPQIAFCPHCRAETLTTIKYEPGAITYLSCLGLVCLGCVWGCCLVPFCITELQDCSHFCSSCNNFINKKSLI